ncbi:helix-turn-helix domain-containing protein [Nocardia cyriacigeorgica]|uniref:helix-turn-helix domain-containing protein n=1 Tax=Nocardia cyriacigeorgica TaxID=135487 RepID=UPI001E6512FD|nr:helix-turn-helix transcriptional regulator [Nocardia cyriacigeorgica]
MHLPLAWNTWDLGERLQSIRKRRGLTQRELAETAGVSFSLVRKVEQGERDDVRIDTLRRLAVALDCPLTALLGPLPISRRAASPMRDGHRPGQRDRIEPRLSAATTREISTWGWLLLRSSAAAVRDNRPDEART